MRSNVGVWIDHGMQYCVDEPVQVVKSNLEKHVRYAGRPMREEGVADDQRDRQFSTNLDTYNDKVIASIADTKFIYIFGPGEAKDEFNNRLEKEVWIKTLLKPPIR